jgi:hypothetical protein
MSEHAKAPPYHCPHCGKEVPPLEGEEGFALPEKCPACGKTLSGDLKERIRDLQTMIEAVVLAIPREIAAYEFYAGLVSKSRSEAARAMFTYLAEQERLHEAKLKSILSDLKSQLELTKIEAKTKGR